MQTSFKDHEGKKCEWFREKATSERITAFCEAVGAKDRGEAPPTFVTVARHGEFGILDEMGVPLSKVLHAEQEYSYVGSLYAGEDLVYQTTLSQVMEKKGGSGSLVFFIFETEFCAEEKNGARRRIGSSRTNLLTRQ